MSHNIESTFYNLQTGVPWHGLGTPVDGLATAAEAIEAASLGWQVEKVPVYTSVTIDDSGTPFPTYQQVPNRYAIQRGDTQHALGIVGPQYQPIQNIEAFDFIDNLVDSGEAKYETAGSLGHGQRIWLLAKLPEGVEVAGEAIESYLLLTNAHDGSGACRVTFTPIRVVCQNTLALALRNHDVKRHVSIRHTGNISTKLQDARKALEIGFSYFADLAETGEQLAEQKMELRDFDRFLRQLVPDPIDRSRSNSRAVAKREEIRTVYLNSDNLNNVRGTAWGALNAVVEYEDHYVSATGKTSRARRERRFTRSLIDPKLKAKAEALLLA